MPLPFLNDPFSSAPNVSVQAQENNEEAVEQAKKQINEGSLDLLLVFPAEFNEDTLSSAPQQITAHPLISKSEPVAHCATGSDFCDALSIVRPVDYHSTLSLSIMPSAESSAVNVLPRYCTHSITNGSEPLLRTERLPSGATLTTLPSPTANALPST